MVGINKVTPSKAIRPVKSNRKKQTRTELDNDVEKPVSKEVPIDTDEVTKHIDERI